MFSSLYKNNYFLGTTKTKIRCAANQTRKKGGGTCDFLGLVSRISSVNQLPTYKLLEIKILTRLPRNLGLFNG